MNLIKGKTRANYSHKLADAAKDQRRAEGNARNAEYQALSLHDKIVRTLGHRGNNRRELLKLTGYDITSVTEKGLEAVQQFLSTL